jgi:hypothetical protein
MVLHPSTTAKIDRWLKEAPQLRRIESLPLANDAWETRALEGGQLVFEEVEVETDEPVLYQLAAWCDRQTKIQPRPPVKANGPLPNASVTRTAAKNR